MSSTEKKFTCFDDFTNLYEIQKTLRFELRPIGKTAELLKKNEVFKKDEAIEAAYQKIKPVFDQLHRKFIAEALQAEHIDVKYLQSFAEEYEKYLSDPKKNKSSLEKAEKKLWKELAKNFESMGEEWKSRYHGKIYRTEAGIEKEIKLKSKGYKILTDEDILHVLAIEYPEQSDLTKAFDGFFTYFSGFNETRENPYKDDGTSTAVVTRIVDNLKKFIDNQEIFKKYLLQKDKLALTNDEVRAFEIESYASCILQEDIEKFNKIAGELNRKMKMLRDEQGKGVVKSDYPLLKTLYDQILGDRKKLTPFSILENDESALELIGSLTEKAGVQFRIFKMLISSLAEGKMDSEFSGIYLTNKAINTLSRKWFADSEAFERLLPQRKKSKEDETLKLDHFISLEDIRLALSKMEGDIFKERFQDKTKIQDRLKTFLEILKIEVEKKFNGYQRESGEDVKGFDILEKQLCQELKNGLRVRAVESKRVVKSYLDSGLEIFRMAKYFSLLTNNKKRVEAPSATSAEFYNEYDRYAKDFRFAKDYDLLRNYLTQKIGDCKDKIKLNFENGSLLSGFDLNKEKEKLGVIFRTNGTVYLGILVDGHKNIFDDESLPELKNDIIEKMEYKFFPDPKRMIPKIAFAASNAERYGLTNEALKIRDEYRSYQEKKKEDKEYWKLLFDRKKLSKLIAYFQHCLDVGGYQKEFDMHWKRPEEYEKLGDFNDDIATQNYHVKFKKISKVYLDERVEKGELYLFEIHNRDFNLYNGKSKIGAKNIHTLYWNELFSEANLLEPMLKLSGGAEIFFRKGRPTELGKRDLKGKEVLEHRRYAEDKLFLHVPIVINRGGEDVSVYKHNRLVWQYLSKNSDACVIGIDRGEKHLLYYSAVNQKGKILDQGSLNSINGIDYYQKLVDCEKQRQLDRQSWETVRKIKDLKEGYISQAVHVVCELMRKYQAIVVLEDLNMAFKQVRGGVERSVYQQFEHAMINKLGNLVFKDKRPEEKGGVFHGYQLAAPFESFEKLGKQTGFLFYTQADYTSVTDPLTGFRKNIYLSNSLDQEKIKEAFSKINIGWDDQEGSYHFTYDQAGFTNDKKQKIPSKVWTIYANVLRMKRTKDDLGHWNAELTNPNNMLLNLFEVWDIQNPQSDVNEKIFDADKQGLLKGEREFDGKKRNFWKSLIYVFNLILQLRNSSSQEYGKNEKGEVILIGENVDFIASPVKPFFMTAFEKDGKKYPARLGPVATRIVGKEKDRIMEEFNGDANGSYNIARKGILIIEKVKENPEKPDLFISKYQWDEFSQKVQEN